MSEDKKQTLVTFVLFAYNQERFIRDAVSSALGQIYEPLEVILSDDHSTDRTFEIMQEMAAAYNGPHRVRVVKNSKNIGVLAHVLVRGREAKGEIIVVAAGDDISMPERTQCLVSVFSSMQDVYAVFSQVKIIDEYGFVICASAQRPLNMDRPVIYIIGENDTNVIQGCSAAYKRDVFSVPVSGFNHEFPEDILFSFYINIMGWKIKRVSKTLVLYRRSAYALSNKIKQKTSMSNIEIDNLKSHKIHKDMLDVLSGLSVFGKNSFLVNKKRLNQMKKFCEIVLVWPASSPAKRLFIFCSMIFYGDFKMMKWMALRIFGKFPRYQPRIFLSEFLK